MCYSPCLPCSLPVHAAGASLLPLSSSVSGRNSRSHLCSSTSTRKHWSEHVVTHDPHHHCWTEWGRNEHEPSARAPRRNRYRVLHCEHRGRATFTPETPCRVTLALSHADAAEQIQYYMEQRKHLLMKSFYKYSLSIWARLLCLKSLKP